MEPSERNAVVTAINLVLGNRDRVFATLQENVETVIRQEDETSSESIDAKLEELQKELLKLANSKKDYNNIADEIYRLWELKQNALVENAEREGMKQRIQERREFLDSQFTEITKYDELLVRRLIGKVTIYEERFEVEFKSGAKVDVQSKWNIKDMVVLCGFGRLQGAFLMGCKWGGNQIVFINQMIYNSGVLMEVENDNVRYDKRVM